MATIPASTQHGGGCACCGTAAETGRMGPAAESVSSVRSRFVAGAEQLGITAADPATPGACHDGCAGVAAAWAQTTPRAPAVRVALIPAGEPGSDIVCTLDGGLDAMRGRIDEWAAVIGRATGREPADGGVTLVYDHDPALTVELARLAAAEFACCSFFSFALKVAPDGVRFTVTAPDEAATVLTALFGTATPATTTVLAGGDR